MSLSLFLLHNKKVNSYLKMPPFLSFIDMKDLCLNCSSYFVKLPINRSGAVHRLE